MAIASGSTVNCAEIPGLVVQPLRFLPFMMQERKSLSLIVAGSVVPEAASPPLK